MILPRKAVLDMQAYSPPLEGRRDKIRLDFNENTVGFPWAYQGLPADMLTTYPEYDDFLNALSRCWDIPKECLLLTNGSDEGLFVIPFTFIEPNIDVAIISAPTFPMIPHYLTLVQARTTEVPVKEDLEFDIPAITAALEKGAKLALFASPDNPTGAVLPLETLENWCQRFPKTLFTIDEAYCEYSGTSCLSLLTEHENLLITRTFSKAWGLAGLRLGVVIGSPKLIHYMTRVRSPYSVNSFSLLSATDLLERAEEISQQTQVTMERKNRFITEIRNRGYRVKAGAANFFLVSIGVEAAAFCAFCKDCGVLVRNRSNLYGMWGTVRVSTGSEDEMKRFLECLDTFRTHRALIFDLDDTLVDTSQSYDTTISELVSHYSGKALAQNELRDLRARGGFNDDWDATVALLTERGLCISREEVECKGKEVYLQRARQVETMFADPALLHQLRQRFRLIIVTGRPRDEYTPVWDDRLNPLFEKVYCQDDFNGARRKPAPDILLAAMKDAGITGGIYIGNAVDDMQAAREAGLNRVAVTTTQSADILSEAGAEYVLDSVNAIGKVLML